MGIWNAWRARANADFGLLVADPDVARFDAVRAQLVSEPIGVDFFALAERGPGPVQGTADESLDQRFGKELFFSSDGEHEEDVEEEGGDQYCRCR